MLVCSVYTAEGGEEEAAKLRDDEKRVERNLILAQEKWEEESKLNRIEVTEEHISEVVSMMTGIPVSKILSTEKSKLSGMCEKINSSLIGQEQAVEKVVKAIEYFKAIGNPLYQEIDINRNYA